MAEHGFDTNAHAEVVWAAVHAWCEHARTVRGRDGRPVRKWFKTVDQYHPEASHSLPLSRTPSL